MYGTSYDIEIFEERMNDLMDLQELSRMTQDEFLAEVSGEMTDDLEDDFPF